MGPAGEDDVVRAHQGLVVLAGALLVASVLGVVTSLGELGRFSDAGMSTPGRIVWFGRWASGSVAWLVFCPVLVGVPRLLGLPEAPREGRWATVVLWCAALLGAGLAVVEVIAFALSFLPDGNVSPTQAADIVGTGIVAAATAALAFGALQRRPQDA